MKTKDTPKKEAILTESFSLFLARGYDAVSISDIEQAAGVTRGAIFHHFSSKKELFKEVANKFTFTFYWVTTMKTCVKQVINLSKSTLIRVL